MKNSTFTLPEKAAAGPPPVSIRGWSKPPFPKVAALCGTFWLAFAGACVSPGSSAGKATPGGEISFQKQVLTTEFIAEGVAVGDVNGDGKTDVLAGAYWFEAPSWVRHELARPEKFFYDKGYSNAFVSQALDVNLDNRVDLVRIGFPGREAQWFENPGKKGGHWPVHRIHDHLGNESAGFYDVDGDGRLDLLGGNSANRQMTWFQAPLVKGQTNWQAFPLSLEKAPGSEPFSHGLGMGDMNLDGRADVIIREGWWEAPSDRRQSGWTFHAAALGEPCSQMYAYDLDRDGDQDVLSASAHQLGIWWHEQRREGPTTWQTHLISNQYTQTHGLAFTDMNDDGFPDLVTGKRYFAHMGKDPGEFQPPVLYWYEFKPGAQPTWIPHLVNNDSGVGVQVLAEDITRDNRKDIIVANKKGVFVFVQQRK